MFDDDDLLAHPLSGAMEARGVERNVVRPVQGPDNSDIDMLMWRGYTPLERQHVPPEPTPAAPPEQVHLTEELPPTGPIRPATWYMFLNKFPVPWEDPIVWSNPYEQASTVTVPFYEQTTPILQYEVPELFLFMLQGVSYEVDGALNNEFFVVDILRSGAKIVEWQEYVINAAAANPANKFAFAGHTRPMPMQLKFDAHEHLTVRVRYRGTKPFAHLPTDVLNRDIKILVHGYLCRLRDSRAGAPKYLSDGPDDYVVNARMDLLHDIPRMAHAMAVIDERMPHGDGSAD